MFNMLRSTFDFSQNFIKQDKWLAINNNNNNNNISNKNNLNSCNHSGSTARVAIYAKIRYGCQKAEAEIARTSAVVYTLPGEGTSHSLSGL